jgi:hypothetical protein
MTNLRLPGKLVDLVVRATHAPLDIALSKVFVNRRETVTELAGYLIDRQAATIGGDNVVDLIVGECSSLLHKNSLQQGPCQAPFKQEVCFGGDVQLDHQERSRRDGNGFGIER